MELNEEITQKIVERFLKRMGEPFSPVVEDIYLDLLDENISVNITIFGKFTAAELEYYRDGYNHHFLGISARNPKDEKNISYGIKNAVEDALGKLFQKFYFEEQYGRLN